MWEGWRGRNPASLEVLGDPRCLREGASGVKNTFKVRQTWIGITRYLYDLSENIVKYLLQCLAHTKQLINASSSNDLNYYY